MPTQRSPTPNAGMKTSAKWLFTAIAVALAAVGAAAIVTEVHSGSTRYRGIVTFYGSDAVWMGQTILLIAAVPLLVWLPSRWVGWAGAVCWLVLMVWIFGGIYNTPAPPAASPPQGGDASGPAKPVPPHPGTGPFAPQR